MEDNNVPEGMEPFNIERAKKREKVITRDGKQVRIICFDANIHDFQIIGLVKSTDYHEVLITFTKSGRYHNEVRKSDLDLFHPAKEMWVNVYKDTSGLTTRSIYPHSSKVNAKKMLNVADKSYVGTYKLVKE